MNTILRALVGNLKTNNTKRISFQLIIVKYERRTFINRQLYQTKKILQKTFFCFKHCAIKRQYFIKHCYGIH